ncbi:Hypothetical protein KVN_LOCUS148 [uncultured virus]|nr:Hypothetical protein KVN_LOCUS148 [uncultured virus]
MKKYSCEKCQSEILIGNNSKMFDKNLNYIFCKKCLYCLPLVSNSFCKKNYLLNQSDIANIKFIYIENPHNKKKMYLLDEIKQIIINKYGNTQKLDNLKNMKHEKFTIKNKVKILKKNERYEELLKVFKENKLEFKNYGDCYSYINYGKPCIQTILNDELKSIKFKNERRIELAKELNKLNIPFDEKLKTCYNFINGIGYKPIDQIVKETEIEYFITYPDKYEEFLKKFNNEMTKKINIDKNNIIVKFE